MQFWDLPNYFKKGRILQIDTTYGESNPNRVTSIFGEKVNRK